MKNTFLIAIFLSLVLGSSLQAQSNQQYNKKKYFADELGITLGAMSYRGELSDVPNIFSSPSFGIGAFYRYHLSRAFAIRADFTYGRVKDEDGTDGSQFTNVRNHSFETDITEISIRAEYSFFDLSTRRETARYFTPYLFGGFGYFSMNPRFNIQPNYSRRSISIPFGVGFKYLVGDTGLVFAMEFGARKTFTDYIDDLGEDLNANLALAAPRNPNYYTGSSNEMDMYFYTAFNISYYLHRPDELCPVKVQ